MTVSTKIMNTLLPELQSADCPQRPTDPQPRSPGTNIAEVRTRRRRYCWHKVCLLRVCLKLNIWGGVKKGCRVAAAQPLPVKSPWATRYKSVFQIILRHIPNGLAPSTADPFSASNLAISLHTIHDLTG